jgi:hypothetical protein
MMGAMRLHASGEAHHGKGKRLVVLVGTAKAVAIAVKRAEARQRYSVLRERLV